MIRSIARGSTAVLCALLVACGGGEPRSAQGSPRTAAAGAQSAGGPAGGRGGRTLLLAANDVATVSHGTIEEGVQVTGTLRPSQTITVRARLEGDLSAVYVREGDRVRAGQILARFEALEEVSGAQSARAEQVAAQGELATAQWNYEQTRELHRAGAVAERDLRAAQQAVTTARARLAAAEARVRSTTSTVSDTRVLAPASAIVSRRLAEPGEHVSRGAELFTLVRNETLELAAAVPERRAASIAPGQRVRFDAAGRPFEGRVDRINPTVDPSTRAVMVYVRVPNPSGQLRGGTFATGTIVARAVEGALVVPLPAIRQSAQGEQFVYRLAGATVEQISVQLGVANETAGVVEVLSGLQAGDRVIVGNVGAVGRDMRVQIVGGDRERGAPQGGATQAR